MHTLHSSVMKLDMTAGRMTQTTSLTWRLKTDVLLLVQKSWPWLSVRHGRIRQKLASWASRITMDLLKLKFCVVSKRGTWLNMYHSVFYCIRQIWQKHLWARGRSKFPGIWTLVLLYTHFLLPDIFLWARGFHWNDLFSRMLAKWRLRMACVVRSTHLCPGGRPHLGMLSVTNNYGAASSFKVLCLALFSLGLALYTSINFHET